jgi:hypothetical protein
MGLKRCLVALHPRPWRARYGEEFAALLDDTPLTPRVVVDIVRHAAALQARAHRGSLLACAALAVSTLAEILFVRTRLTTNILWVPDTPARAAALLATVGPWFILAATTLARRRPGRRDAAPDRPPRW